MENNEFKSKLTDYDLAMNQSPHFFDKWSSQWIMLQVIIAMLFPTIAAVIFFGPKSLLNIGVAILASVLSEFLYEKIVRKRVTVTDLSAFVTGMLIGLSMPLDASWWTIALVSIGAIVIIKMIPGGVGKNRFNPAVGGRIFYLLLPWVVNAFVTGEDVVTTASSAEAITSATPTDLVATATPLYYISSGVQEIPSDAQTLMNLFLGDVGGWGGAIGETSKLALIIAMVYLILRKVINPKIPLLYLGTVGIIMFVYSGFDFQYMMYHLLSGSLFFAGTFMVTDYSTGGITPQGRTVFAIGAGILTAAFRIAPFSPEGVGFSILLMNAIIPFVDKELMPRIYGHKNRPKLDYDYSLTEPLNKVDVTAK